MYIGRELETKILSGMEEEKKSLSRLGEDIACSHLLKNDYEIVKRNFRFGHGEIDIVAKKEGILVFVEVKTRKNPFYGEPEEAVTRPKQKQIIKIAKAYLYVNSISDTQCRFDVIAVSFGPDGVPGIKHYLNAFIDM